MTIDLANHKCLMCERLLVPKHEPITEISAPRSEEHLFPKAIKGKVVTFDVCSECNSTFSAFDKLLLEDARVMKAVERAGLGLADFAAVQGHQELPDGRSVKTTIAKGGQEMTMHPTFHPGGYFLIGAPDGRVARKHREAAKGFLKANRPFELHNRIEEALEKFFANPSAGYVDEELGLDLRAQFTEGRLKAVYTSSERTDLAICKMVLEAHATLVDPRFRSVHFDFANRMRDALRTGEAVPWFRFEELEGTGDTSHNVEGRISMRREVWRVTLFGSACWECTARFDGLPDLDAHQTITLRNPLDHFPASLKK